MKWLLRLYPPAWRRRYEAEMGALLDEQRAGTRTAWDRAVVRRLAPVDWPWDTISQIVFWSLFIVLTAWRARQPWARTTPPERG